MANSDIAMIVDKSGLNLAREDRAYIEESISILYDQDIVRFVLRQYVHIFKSHLRREDVPQGVLPNLGRRAANTFLRNFINTHHTQAS